jgi:glycosyltransferase involved in cell wall biosynthesis
VLHVLNSPVGGAAESTVQLIEGLADRGIESVAVCHDSGSRQDFTRVQDAVGGRLHRTRLWWTNRRLRADWWKRPLIDVRESLRTGRGARSGRIVTEVARLEQVDLIHTNTILTPEGAIAARSLGLPHVWHLRELVGSGSPFRFWREPHYFGSRVARHCDVLVANSPGALERVRSWLPAGLAVMVPNGIDVGAFTDAVPPIDRTPVTVGMVANLTSRWKRHSLFVDAAAQVDRSLDVRFVLVGNDPPGDRYAEGIHREVEESGLADRFTFVGFHEDVPALMADLDVLVHPAELESFGRIAIEAMAAGRPVVGVAGGGIGEIVVDGVTGRLVPVGDAAALASAIAEVVADPDLRLAWGEAGRQRAAEHYSIDAMVDGMVDAYLLALDRHRSGPGAARAVPGPEPH